MAGRDAFSLYHPAVIFLYFVGAIVCGMVTLEPGYTAISLAVSAGYFVFLRGWKRFIKVLLWYGIAFLAVALVNPLFNSLGLTVLFYLGDQPVTLEAVVYGLCSGGMLVSVLLWFSCYQEVMTSEKFLYLFAKTFPTLSMMVSMIFRFVPALIRNGKAIANAQKAMLGAGTDKKEKTFHGIRMVSILMSWSMENALETADSMRARGYGTAGRTSYADIRIKKRDIWALVLIAVLLVCNVVFFILQTASFRFYPRIAGWPAPWWSYAVYALFLCLPMIFEGKERIPWMR